MYLQTAMNMLIKYSSYMHIIMTSVMRITSTKRERAPWQRRQASLAAWSLPGGGGSSPSAATELQVPQGDVGCTAAGLTPCTSRLMCLGTRW